MQLSAGIYIKSTQALQNTYFEDTVLIITEYNDKGAMGFVINKPFGRVLSDLEEFSGDAALPLYEGGPVDKEHLFFVHQRPDLVEEGTRVGNGIYYGGQFKQAVAGLNENKMSADDLKVFVGYCGWDKGELEAEIKEGSWDIIEASKDDLFTNQ